MPVTDLTDMRRDQVSKRTHSKVSNGDRDQAPLHRKNVQIRGGKITIVLIDL